ncbi:hypothetical protein J3R83DRAFT_7937 [Lanmaoa asiatica]|nr:hypothetical protein J3R83DRAFT_7937 [Lanmaoa asiatica]
MAIQIIPFGMNDDALDIQVLGNTTVEGNNIEAMPDILMHLFYRCSASHWAFRQTCFALECAFTQSKMEVHCKLSKYIADFLEIIAILKIIIKETPYAAPRE